MSRGQREIVLCFLPLDSDLLERSWLNYGAGKIAPKRKYSPGKKAPPPMVHVELLIKDDDGDEGFAASICYNRKVHYMKKKFSRKNWHFRSLFVTDAQHKKLKLWLSSQRGCPFNKFGFFMLGLTGMRFSGNWSTRFGWKPRYFCCELIVKALKVVGYFQESPTSLPTVCHPEELYQYTSIISCPTSHPVRELDVGSFQY